MKRKLNRPSLLIGSLFTLFGLAGLAESVLLARRAERATATVVKSEPFGSGRRVRHDVTIAFRAADGAMRQAVLENETSADTPIEPGKEVAILYQTDKPSRVRRDIFFRTWGAYGGFALFGLIVNGVSILSHRWSAARSTRA